MASKVGRGWGGYLALLWYLFYNVVVNVKQQRQLASALSQRAQRARPDSLFLWTVLHRVNLKPGVKFDLTEHRYLIEIYQSQARELVIYKASQMGASEFAISYALHAADVRQMTVLYVFPTDTHVSDFSMARIGPAIEASAYLESIIVEGGAATGEGERRQRGVDRVTLKRVRDNYLYLRGARIKPSGQAAQLKSVDADLVVLDEMDEMDPRAAPIAMKRLGHSKHKNALWISTPTYPGIGIHAKYLESDQRRWFLRCPSCGKKQTLTIDNVIQEWDELGRPVAWHGQAEGEAYVACGHCGARMDVAAPGEWVAQHPGRQLAGYHLTKSFSAAADWPAIVKSLCSTDATVRSECYNQDLGLPYAPRGDRLTDAALDKCRRNYAHGVPVLPRGIAVAGADVGTLIHVVIRASSLATGIARQIWAGAVSSFEELSYLMRHYRVATMVIDALPETRKCREFQAEFRPGQVYLAYYVAQKVGLKKVLPVQINDAEWIVNLDRTRTIDQMLANIREQEWTLPGHARDIEDYYSHMTAIIRQLVDTTAGAKVARYIQTGDDHFAHAENYCGVALSLPVMVPLAPQKRLKKETQWT